MPSTRKARSTVRVYPEMLTKLCGGTYWQWFSRSCIGRRRVCSKSLFEEHMYTFPYRAVDSLKNTCDGCAMKKLLVFALILLSFLFVSCVTSFDRTLLQHSASSIDPKVPNLELKNENPDFSVGRSNSKALSTNFCLCTIFERECENNLIEWNGDDKWGTIDLIVIDASLDDLVFTTRVYVEIELRIFDINGKKVWANPIRMSERLLTGLLNRSIRKP